MTDPAKYFSGASSAPRRAPETRWVVNWRLIIAIWLAVGSWTFLIGVVRLTAHLWGG